MVNCGLDCCHIDSGSARLGIEDEKVTMHVCNCSECSRWIVDVATSVFEDNFMVPFDKVGYGK
jgi:hypothetical protein